MKPPVDVWLNGQTIRLEHEKFLSLPNQLGVFETMASFNGEIPLWDYHWRRIFTSCRQLKLTLPHEHDVTQLIATLPKIHSSQVVKLYATQNDWLLSLHHMPDYPECYTREGIKAMICKTRLPQKHPHPGLKLNQRENYQRATEEFAKLQMQEGILLDANDSVIEGTKTNVFIVVNGVIVTPKLDNVGVAGVSRQWLIDQAALSNIPMRETNVSISALNQADEIFLSNALIGLWPVRELQGRVFKIGPITRYLMSKIRMLHGITEKVD